MIRKDYIMRLMEQLAEVIAGVLLNKRKGQYDQAVAALDDAVLRFTGIESGLAESFDIEGLLVLLRHENEIDTGRGMILAELLREKAEVIELSQGFEPATNLYAKSLRLYLECLSESPDLRMETHFRKIDGIAGKLEHYEIPVGLRAGLFRYCEWTGRFDRAEDHLFEWIESGDPRAVIEGPEFLKRLLDLPDETLIRGGLPREEVLSALRELESGD